MSPGVLLVLLLLLLLLLQRFVHAHFVHFRRVGIGFFSSSSSPGNLHPAHHHHF